MLGKRAAVEPARDEKKKPPPPPPKAATVWTALIDPEKNEMYYHNRITNETTWDTPPQLKKAKPPPPPKPAASQPHAAALTSSADGGGPAALGDSPSLAKLAPFAKAGGAVINYYGRGAFEGAHITMAAPTAAPAPRMSHGFDLTSTLARSHSAPAAAPHFGPPTHGAHHISETPRGGAHAVHADAYGHPFVSAQQQQYRGGGYCQ